MCTYNQPTCSYSDSASFYPTSPAVAGTKDPGSPVAEPDTAPEAETAVAEVVADTAADPAADPAVNMAEIKMVPWDEAKLPGVETL